MINSKDIINIFKKKGYEFDIHEHKPLYTVNDSSKLRGKIKGGHSKNLFLKNKKNKFYLMSCEEHEDINLKKISKLINLGNISFGKEEYLYELLGVKPGSVTPFGLLNDSKNTVDFYLEKKLYEYDFLNFHPLRNTATITIKAAHFISFMIDNNKKIHIFSAKEGVILKTYG